MRQLSVVGKGYHTDEKVMEFYNKGARVKFWSVRGAGLYSSGIPRNSIIEYETSLKAGSFLVVARGSAEEMARAKAIVAGFKPTHLDSHKLATAA